MFDYTEYQRLAPQIDWSKQIAVVQQTHEFVPTAAPLYADNRHNAIGQLLDLHFSKVQAKVNRFATDLFAKAQQKIKFLQRHLATMPAAQQTSAQKKINFLSSVK
jgi:hypothetical protein